MKKANGSADLSAAKRTMRVGAAKEEIQRSCSDAPVWCDDDYALVTDAYDIYVD